VLAQTPLAAAGGPGLLTLRNGRGFLAIALRKAPGALDGRSSLGVHRAEQGRVPLLPAMTPSSAADLDLPSATRVRLDGAAVLATGPGYTLRIRLDGCTVVELLQVATSRSIVVGGRVPLEKGEGAVATAAGWRSQGGFLRIGSPFTRLQMRVEAGSDRYRTAVLRARVSLPAGRTLRVERGAVC
jgi:hypothetical protein